MINITISQPEHIECQLQIDQLDQRTSDKLAYVRPMTIVTTANGSEDSNSMCIINHSHHHSISQETSNGTTSTDQMVKEILDFSGVDKSTITKQSETLKPSLDLQLDKTLLDSASLAITNTNLKTKQSKHDSKSNERFSKSEFYINHIQLQLDTNKS